MKDIYEYCDIKIMKMKLVFVPEKLLVTKMQVSTQDTKAMKNY